MTDRSAAVEHAEEVVLTPHHTLGHARRAAGVEQIEIVAAPHGRRGRTHTHGRDRFELLAPLRCRDSGTVIDPQPEAYVRHPLTDRFDRRRERRVEHDAFGPRVGPEMHQLVRDVSIVGVHRGHRHLERGEDRFEELDAVDHVLGHAGTRSQPGELQPRRNRIGPCVELCPGTLDATSDDSDLGRLQRGDPLPDLGEVPVGRHRAPPDHRHADAGTVPARRAAHGCSEGAK